MWLDLLNLKKERKRDKPRYLLKEMFAVPLWNLQVRPSKREKKEIFMLCFLTLRTHGTERPVYCVAR